MVSAAEMWSHLIGEPFYLRPWEIAELTDWQVEHLYGRYAARVDAEMKRAKGEKPDAPGEAGGDDGSPPRDREGFVAWWARVNGGGREEALRKRLEVYPDADG